MGTEQYHKSIQDATMAYQLGGKCAAKEGDVSVIVSRRARNVEPEAGCCVMASSAGRGSQHRRAKVR